MGDGPSVTACRGTTTDDILKRYRDSVSTRCPGNNGTFTVKEEYKSGTNSVSVTQ